MQNKSKQNFKTCNNLSERTTAASEEEADAKPRDDGLSLWQALVYISTYDQLQLNQASISELRQSHSASFSHAHSIKFQYQCVLKQLHLLISPILLLSERMTYDAVIKRKHWNNCSLRSWRNPLPKVGQAYDRHLLGSWRSTSHQMRNIPGQRGPECSELSELTTSGIDNERVSPQ